MSELISAFISLCCFTYALYFIKQEASKRPNFKPLGLEPKTVSRMMIAGIILLVLATTIRIIDTGL